MKSHSRKKNNNESKKFFFKSTHAKESYFDSYHVFFTKRGFLLDVNLFCELGVLGGMDNVVVKRLR